MKGDDDLRWAAVERWIAVAHSDRLAINACMAVQPPLRTVAAFHCQQAIEKLLKGFLLLAAMRFRKTHSLGELGVMVATAFPEIAEQIETIDEWTSWATAYRYPVEGSPEPELDDPDLQRAISIIDGLQALLQAKQPISLARGAPEAK